MLRWLVEDAHAKARTVFLLTNKLNTHTPGRLYAAFAPDGARRIAGRLE
jgi:hypothetical protein